ncbi:MAG TPA: immunoglobulin domain-containing protein [Phycisphaerae bacterium]|nr:immunoglobulin domain-containing protein [Phycisphaerae bacterium]HRY70091.1 immunoglobulin domain-containing protein [Phycisphaerae bacterium]HSA27367.1 immunoglobulin domain-containing protein [Phycisphaerae bacterium]
MAATWLENRQFQNACTHTRSEVIALLILVGVLLWPAKTSAQCPVTWAQWTPATAPSARAAAVAAYDSTRGVAVLFGGYTGSSLGETWEWDGADWTQRTPATAPPARNAHAMAYDSARGVTVLFGGRASGFFGDTWEWDGTSWTQRTPATSPSARQYPVMAYDSARGVTVLFGGTNASWNLVSDTWEWNGTNWTQRTPATSPSARQAHAAAYDSARGKTVLFGGFGGGTLGDTWEWDGTNWMQRTPAAAPAARYYHAMTYDGARGVTTLFGGQASAYFGDTWEWNGTNWTQRTFAAAPSARAYHTMVWGAGAGTMLFGGYGARYLGDTWQYGPVVRVAQQPVSCTVVSGGDAGFGITVVSTASDIPIYQWRKDGTPIPGSSGANKAFLRIPSAKPSDAGSYDCVVTAGACAWVSAPAALAVLGYRADFDGDADVDMDDFGLFQRCFTGPAIPANPACSE